MSKIKVRKWAFELHRYIGLAISLILIIVGLTGSLLVFSPEIDSWLVQQQFGWVIPQAQTVPLEQAVDIVKTKYAIHKDWQLHQVKVDSHQDFYTVRLKRPDDTQWEVFVNPYTGKIMGDRQRETAFFARVLDLHYQLLAGQTGTMIVGVVGFLLFVLSITGLLLWNGWRKLIAGFKIKWNAHPKRINFDIHKVVGIISAIFLSMIALTGFCWNFSDYAEPAIYAFTLSQKTQKFKSMPVKDKNFLGIGEVLMRSQSVFPDAVTTFVNFPRSKDGVFEIYKKLPKNLQDFENSIQIEPYTGQVLHVKNSMTGNLGDKVLNAFTPMHYGTFGGIPTRILYVFVGLSPIILAITGLTMFRLRRWAVVRRKEVVK